MLNEIRTSVKEYLADRLKSPFYSVFVISWCIWNWKVLYITLFTESNVLWEAGRILKIDYINDLYLLGWNLNTFCSLSHLIILPLASTYFFVYVMPHLTERFYEKSLDFDNRNEVIKLRKNKELLVSKEKNLEITKKVVALQREEKETRNRDKTQEDLWDEEYKEFKEARLFVDFRQIHDAVYARQGWASRVPTDIKAYSDSNGLIKIDLVNGNERIILTDKGKYFMKQFTKDIPF